MRLIRNWLLISAVIKSNIALGLSWYGSFYNQVNVSNSAEPFTFGAAFSGVLFWMFAALISEKEKWSDR